MWYNLVALAVSCAFDIYDTILYYFFDVHEIDRSRWTVDRLEQEAANKKKHAENTDKEADQVKSKIFHSSTVSFSAIAGAGDGVAWYHVAFRGVRMMLREFGDPRKEVAGTNVLD